MMNRKISKTSLSLMLASLAGLSACSLKHEEGQLIRIELPSPAVNASRASTLNLGNGFMLDLGTAPKTNFEFTQAAPASFSLFQCYALNVTGPGIPAENRVGCSDPAKANMGKLGGMVPVSQGYIDMIVPTGTGRTVQLIGVTLKPGYTVCPNFDTLLGAVAASTDSSDSSGTTQNGATSGDTSGTTTSTSTSGSGGGGVELGVSEPYLLGTAYNVDTLTDTTVTIQASYDPNTAKPMFADCGGDQGVAVALTEGYKGYQTTPFPGPSPIASPTPTGVPAPSGGDIVGTTALTATEIAAITTHSSVSPPPSTEIVTTAAIGSSDYRRAIIQLRYDVTNYASAIDAGDYPYFSFHALIAGGNSCNTSSSNNPYSASVSPFMGAVPQWLPGWGQNQGVDVFNEQYFMGGKMPYPTGNSYTSDFVTTIGSQTFLVIDVLSNFYSSSATCESRVTIEAAELKLIPKTKRLEISPNAHWTPAAQVATNGSMTIFATGGSPTNGYTSSADYTFTVNPGCGTISHTSPSVSATFVAPSAPCTAHVMVTDSLGAQDAVDIPVFTPPSLNLFRITTGVVQAGSCQEFQIEYQDSLGTPTPAPTNLPGMSLKASPDSGIYTDSGCNTPLSGGMQLYFPAGASRTGSYYYKAYTESVTGTRAANHYIQVSLGGGGGMMPTVAPDLFTLAVYPQNPPGYWARVDMPDLTVPQGLCVPLTLKPTDQFGNWVSATSALSFTLGTSFGTFYANSTDCGSTVNPISTPTAGTATSVTMPVGTGGVTVYYKNTGSSTDYYNLTGVTYGNPSWPSNATALRAIPASFASRFTLTAASATLSRGACTAVTITAKDTGGVTQPLYSSTSIQMEELLLSGLVDQAGFYSDAGCTTWLNSPALSAGFTTATYYFKADSAGTYRLRVREMFMGSDYVDVTVN